jgi:hypothetical protein
MAMPALANPTPNTMPDAANKMERRGEKNRIGPITVERISRNRTQRGNVLAFQDVIANKSRPTANVSAPTG